MTKRIRLLIILVLAGVAFSFLYPTIKWYLWVPQNKKELSAGSRTQIRLYAQRTARDSLARIMDLDETDPVPAEFDFLLKAARERFKLEDRTIPRTWTNEQLLQGYLSREEILLEMEAHYRDEIFDLKDLRERTLQLGLDLLGGIRVQIEPDFEILEAQQETKLTADERSDAVDRVLEILNTRIDRFGVTEPLIRKDDSGKIILEMPGVADPERINRYIVGKGSLNFHIVDDEALQLMRDNPKNELYDWIAPDGTIVQPDFLPAGTILRGVYQKDEYGVDLLKGYTVLEQEIALDGNLIRDAQVTSDQLTGKPLVHFLLTSEGGDRFYKITSENVNKTLAVVLDDKVKAQATILEAIRDSVSVRGFEREEADDLALVLRTGALPVPLNITNQEQVGATLGEDTIRIGRNAIILGFLLVVVFMLIYYKGAGLIADFALVLNLYFLVAILSVFGYTLTLPSIAGVVLTVGMAVDANVIIFERIKEEYRIRTSPAAAVRAGFSKAFWTVMDANITTFIAALALSQLGKGTIKGFAFTLAIGIVSSMFTALFVSRLIFDFSTDVLKLKKLRLAWRRA